MLVLSRKKNEVIQISAAPGVNIEIMVVEIRGDKVRLGITAPSEIPVHRLEVAEAIKMEKEIARRRESAKPRQSIRHGITGE